MHVRVQLAPRLFVHRVDLLIPIDRQRIQMCGHLVPLGRIARQRTRDRAVHHLVLQRGHHFAERHGHAGAAQRLDELGLCAAAGAHLLAFDVREPLDVGIAEQHLRRIGGHAQQPDARLRIELGVHRLERIGHRTRRLHIGRQARQINGLVDRVVGGEVRQR
ncbi:hypothetical protein SDC9_181559 [bioreactor metagenome]|uniref:Uncharacterized protein n=1 Tax=bioreactor metagenome TaxID=1076179 RepID=A0A645H4X3_9ZZZZ